jgi:outer membrane receptor protein involved in Fe transport
MPTAPKLARLLLFAVLALSMAHAQISTGTIVGIVADSTGGVVPNAAVTIAHTATGEIRSFKTNDNGQFNAPFMPLGDYVISVSAAGFQNETLSGINLQVDQTASLHIALKVGSVSQTVEVTGAAPLVDQVTSSLGQVIDNKEVLNMPLNGRNPFALGLLVGNTTQVFGMGSNLPFIAGGGRFSEVDVSLNGVDNNTFATAGSIGRNGIAIVPSVDAVQEFKVMTNNFAAEYGHAAGSIVSATIKSGSNQFHGVAFEFLRNDDFDANNYFTNLAGLPRSPFHQNQFGGTLGGPIIHNRVFFFGDYQGTRQSSVSGSSIENIPSQAFRTGDFSSSPTTIYDPTTRHIGPSGTVLASPFPGNKIPANMINPTALAILSLIPAPNFGTPGALTRNYFYQAPQFSNTDQGDIRIDATISSKNSMFGSYSISNNYQPAVGTFPGFIGGGSSALDDSDQITLSDVHSFTSSLINEFRLGYIRNNGTQPGSGQEGASFGQKAGLALFPAPVLGFPVISFDYSGGLSGSTEFTAFGGGDKNLNILATKQLADNLSWTRGRHSMKFGADIRKSRFDVLKGDPFFGQTIFGAIFSSSSDAPGSGLPFADFLMGFPSQINGSPMLAEGHQLTTYFGGYAQDDWKVSNRLTLNLGLRYELYTQPIDENNLGSLFNLQTGEFAVPGQDGYSRAIVQGDHNDWAPRVGFAYQLTPRFVTRGGFGLFYAMRDQNQSVTQFSGNTPNVPTVSLAPVIASQTVTPPFNISTPIKVLPATTNLSGFTPTAPYGVEIKTQSLNNARMPQLYQFNLDLQYQLTGTTLVEGSYSGALGRHQSSLFVDGNQVPFSAALTGQNKQADRPFSNINANVLGVYSTASSSYDAMNLKVQQRLSHGLQLLANYSWQKNIESQGTGPDSYTQNGGTSIAMDTYDLSRERGVAPINVAHTFTTSASYELPFGPGKLLLSGNGLAQRLLGGWVVNGILTLRTGFPSDIRTNVLPPVFNTLNVASCVPGVPMKLPHPGVEGFFNPAAFTVPQVTTSTTGASIQEFGNCGRRIAVGPGSKNLDSSIFKNFYFTDSQRIYLQFRTEFFNTTNTPTFYLPSASDPTLTCEGAPGAICNQNNSSFGKLSDGTATGRQIQFSAKLYF